MGRNILTNIALSDPAAGLSLTPESSSACPSTKYKKLAIIYLHSSEKLVTLIHSLH